MTLNLPEILSEHARTADEGSLEVARDVFKAGTLINAGAFVAMPAFLQVFDQRGGQLAEILFTPLACFGLGCLASGLGMAAAYFTMAYRGDAFRQESYALMALNVGNILEHEKRYALSGRQWKLTNVFRVAAIVMASITYCLFVYGGYRAYASVSEQARAPSSAEVSFAPHLKPSAEDIPPPAAEVQ